MKAGYLCATIVFKGCTCIEVANYKTDNVVLNIGWAKKEWANTNKKTIGVWKLKK